MKIDYKNGKQIVIHPTSVVSIYDKEHYEALIERYQRDFAHTQSLVSNAMEAIGLIDASKNNFIPIN